MALSVDIEKKMGNFHLKIKFDVKNEILAILGASGSGKSMTLKCIAGIERPDRGRIVLDGVTLFDSEKRINLPPQKRKIGYLFQQYALFPDMTVEQNICCGIRNKNNKEEIVKDILQSMDLVGREKMKPHQLSGGQQQRVALARILVNEPEVMLLDEPFSALDSFLRFQLEREVHEIMKRFGKTVIFVSHDRDEVFRLSDSIAVIKEGAIETIGTKKEVFHNPMTRDGAILTGCKNISAADIIDETHIYAKEWDMVLKIPKAEKDVKYIGIRMHDMKVRDEECENKVICEVAGEIENPFSYTIMVVPKGKNAKSMIGIQVRKDHWEKIRNSQIIVSIPEEEILLLKE